MMNFLRNLYYSFPVQLFILHFKRYQSLLFFWYILFSTIGGYFMKDYGGDALFLSPEYLGNVNSASAAIVGVATGIFIMSWNITTFILHSRRFRFLATTTKPFFKYCINNFILPIGFLLFYGIEAYNYETKKELVPIVEFLFTAAGFTGGFVLLIAFSFAYFFTADRRIVRDLTPLPNVPEPLLPPPRDGQPMYVTYDMKVGYYLSTRLKFKMARDVRHYGEDFLNLVFKRHHFSAIISVVLAFVFMIFVGFFLDHKIFQFPAAASIIIFFALMIALIGALAYFLKNWSILFIILLFLILNTLYQYDLIDPRNKAYGINYNNKSERPVYNEKTLEALCTPEKIELDKRKMIEILDAWKKKQKEQKPVMIFMNFSGGGARSASFAMNVLQQLDSVTNGNLMKKTFLMSGASGGMLSAAYFRELYLQKQHGRNINLHNSKYLDDISGDLLNPVLGSMIARDIFSPAQKFTFNGFNYVKDRGYAFEQKLNDNTEGLLDKRLDEYRIEEGNANVPLMIFNSVITKDGRKLIISPQPVSFMMKSGFVETDSSTAGPDAVDFAALFQKQDGKNIRVLTALRMNATFPYVLPGVWLPTQPIIDASDAGIRDNYGQETTLRFLSVFRDWIKVNTGGVLLIQVRDRSRGSWEQQVLPDEITGLLTEPGTILQNNWFKLQEYFQNDQISYAKYFLDSNFHRIAFMYLPERPDKGAPLNFHLTASEKKEIISSMGRTNNIEAFESVKKYFVSISPKE